MAPEIQISQAHWLTTVPMPLRSLLQVRAVDTGFAKVVLEPQPWMDSTLGAALLLADDALGLATTGAMPLGSLAVSVELTIDAVAPLPDRPGTLFAQAQARHLEGDMGFGTGVVSDAAGHELALIAVRSLRSRNIDPEKSGLDPAAEFKPPAVGGPLFADAAVANASGVVHGGVVAIAGVAAARRAVAPLEVVGARVFYARPIPAAGGEITTETVIVRHGRRAGLVHVAVIGPEGERAAHLTATAVAKSAVSHQGGSNE